MKIRANKKSFTVSEIYNEAQMEIVNDIAEIAECNTKWKDCNTKCIISGDEDEMHVFVDTWNSYNE